MERKRTLQDEPSTSWAHPSSPPINEQKEENGAEISSQDEQDSSAESSRKDQEPSPNDMDPEAVDKDTRDRWKGLHDAIEMGDLKLVKQILCNQAPWQHFRHGKDSALYKAYCCKNYEIAAYLHRIQAKIQDFELKDLKKKKIHITTTNYYLMLNNKKLENSCIYYFMSRSQCADFIEKDHFEAMVEMYKNLFECETTRLLMKVLENVPFDIVCDFKSGYLDRINRSELKDNHRVTGLTLTNYREIFLGAKNLLSTDKKKKKEVYGVLAEELCHLVMEILFNNRAKPYKNVNYALEEEFGEILESIKSSRCKLAEKKSSVIREVFGYEPYKWVSELIARIPYVIGKLGEEKGREFFEGLDELRRLLEFYDKNVIEKCKQYVDPSLNTGSHRMMEKLMKRRDFISFQEKEIRPLREDFESFTCYLNECNGTYLISTNCVKLSTLHVYHDLKREYGDLKVLKKCLFFSKEIYEKNREEILYELKKGVWNYLILSIDDKHLNKGNFEEEYNFCKSITDRVKVIVISGSHLIRSDLSENNLNYKWNDLSGDYKYHLATSLSCIFKGKEEKLSMEENDISFFREDDLQKIICWNVFEVSDGEELATQGYVPDTYIERNFEAVTVNERIFNELPPNSSIYLTGLSKMEFKTLQINKRLVQWIKAADDEIKSQKAIFITERVNSIKFDEFREKVHTEFSIWLHHDDKSFYLVRSDSVENLDNWLKNYRESIPLCEEEIAEVLKRKRILLIAENAGYGKSTVISSLIQRMQKLKDRYMVWRIDFQKLCVDPEKDPLSIGNIPENGDYKKVLEQFYNMLGINNGLEKLLFMKFRKKKRCYLYFDGVDETPSEDISKAKKLLKTLRNDPSFCIAITTRKNYQGELEDLLETYSHHLVPFCHEEQTAYLGKIWKCLLKYRNVKKSAERTKDEVQKKINNFILELRKEKNQRSLKDLIDKLEKINFEKSLAEVMEEINGVEFKGLAEEILQRRFSDEEMFEFIGVPLHLSMIGEIYAEGNSNIQIQTNVYNLYSSFIDKKVSIYVEDKQGMQYEKRLKKKTLKSMKGKTYIIHAKLAKMLIDEGKELLASDLEEEDREFCCELGIVSIHGDKVQFIHRTFAEYFWIEALKENINKETFINVIFDRKNIVIRRFLSGALETQGNESPAFDFFKDVNFIIRMIDKIAPEHVNYMDPDLESIFMIMKKILGFLQNHFYFIIKLHEFFEELKRKNVVYCTYIQHITRVGILCWDIRKMRNPSFIGNFVTVDLIKHLLQIDLNEYFGSMLLFVKCAEDPQEVRDLIQEYISVTEAKDICSQNQSVNKIHDGNKLLVLKNEEGSVILQLLKFALWNKNEEIFVSTLKLFREKLDGECYMTLISKDLVGIFEEYTSGKETKNLFSFLSKLAHDFKKDKIIRFSNDFRDAILGKFIFAKDNDFNETAEEFSEVLKECFGNDSGNIELVNAIKNSRKGIKNTEPSDGEKVIIQRFLKRSRNYTSFSFGKETGNILQSALHAREGKFEETLEYCSRYLEKSELVDMVHAKNSSFVSVLELLVKYKSLETLMENLNMLRNYVDDAEQLKKLLGGVGKGEINILHYTADNSTVPIKEVLEFCEDIFEKDYVIKMITSFGEYGYNVLHLLARSNSKKNLIENLSTIKDYVANVGQFKLICGSPGKHNKNILHSFAYNSHGAIDVGLNFCENVFGNESVKEMLTCSDSVGNSILHVLVYRCSEENLMKHMQLICTYVDDAEKFMKILCKIDGWKDNILHIMAYKIKPRVEIFKFCYSILGKNDVIKMITSLNTLGCNVLHLLARNNCDEDAMNILRTIVDYVNDLNQCKEMFRCLLRDNILDDDSINKVLNFCGLNFGGNYVRE